MWPSAMICSKSRSSCSPAAATGQPLTSPHATLPAGPCPVHTGAKAAWVAWHAPAPVRARPMLAPSSPVLYTILAHLFFRLTPAISTRYQALSSGQNSCTAAAVAGEGARSEWGESRHHAGLGPDPVGWCWGCHHAGALRVSVVAPLWGAIMLGTACVGGCTTVGSQLGRPPAKCVHDGQGVCKWEPG